MPPMGMGFLGAFRGNLPDGVVQGKRPQPPVSNVEGRDVRQAPLVRAMLIFRHSHQPSPNWAGKSDGDTRLRPRHAVVRR